MLVINISRVQQQYCALHSGFGAPYIHYVVKANPMPRIISRLGELETHFDAASHDKTELVLGAGAKSTDVALGNTFKLISDSVFFK
ncbi:MAG: hypothetical protein OSA51_07475 [Octadecabacter sp.]|nr:hypothetical protein [Octadecabacter sp.]